MSVDCTLAAWTDLFTSHKFMSNEPWRWLVLFCLVLGALLTGKVVTFFLLRQAERLDAAKPGQLLSTLFKSMAGPLTLLLLAVAVWITGSVIYYTRTVVGKYGEAASVTELLMRLPLWLPVCEALGAVAVSWFLFRLVDIIEHFLRRLTFRSETSLDNLLVPLIRKTMRVFVVVVAALFIAQNIFRWNIGAMLAGLGIGGLAAALAAKDALSNLFGSVTIFSDRPFHMGDRVKIGPHDGTVEQVGFRSTRLRTMEGSQLVIPNAVISTEAIENIARRRSIRRIMNIPVPFSTAPQKMQRGLEILREMLAARKDHFPIDLPPQVFFNEFNPASLNIFVIYWYAPPEWWEYQTFNEEFNLELLRRFNEEGIEFATPAQTVQVKQGSPLSAAIHLEGGPGDGDGA